MKHCATNVYIFCFMQISFIFQPPTNMLLVAFIFISISKNVFDFFQNISQPKVLDRWCSVLWLPSKYAERGPFGLFQLCAISKAIRSQCQLTTTNVWKQWCLSFCWTLRRSVMRVFELIQLYGHDLLQIPLGIKMFKFQTKSKLIDVFMNRGMTVAVSRYRRRYDWL